MGKPDVRVTSSSSRSSSSSVSSSVSSSRSSSSSSSTGGRMKKVKKSINRKDSSQLHELSPQERLVKKVQETLRNDNKRNEEETKDIVRPSSPRKKVIFRKRKDEEVTKLPRTG